MVKLPKRVEGNDGRIGAAGDEKAGIEEGLHWRHIACQVPAPISLQNGSRQVEMVLSGDHQLQILHALQQVWPYDEGMLDGPPLAEQGAVVIGELIAGQNLIH